MKPRSECISLPKLEQNSWIWQEKPFSYGQAWISLIFQARNAKTYKARGSTIKCEAGSLITSEAKLSEEFGWSRTRLRNFLELLEEDEKIKLEKDSTKTRISINNFGTYVKFKTTRATTNNPDTPQNPAINQKKQEIRACLLSLFSELTPQTKADYSRLNKLINDFFAKDANPRRINLLSETYKSHWSDVSFTPEALLKHWLKLKELYLADQKERSVVG